MKVTILKHSREYTFHGLSRWIGMEASVDECDNEKECLHKLEQIAKDFVQESIKASMETVTTESQSPEPAILPVIKEKKIVTTMGFSAYCDKINNCTTIEELKEHKAIADMNPKLVNVYNEKLKTFQS